ncbi:hypothetical protein, partial [Anaerotruncus colihominis]|uniref:hypothetical protein n=1 Tax=Anaerotruncus colihominis TaxID=169435 RepID=UPI00210EF114
IQLRDAARRKALGLRDDILHRPAAKRPADQRNRTSPPEKLCEIVPPGAICGETAPDFTALLGQPRALPVVFQFPRRQGLFIKLATSLVHSFAQAVTACG